MSPRRAGVIAAICVLASSLPRVLLAADLLPRQLGAFVWSDVLFTYLRGLGGHRLPYRDAPFEYPPLVGAISGALSLATVDAWVYIALWSAVLALAAGIAAAAMAGAVGARRVVFRWALAPQLLLLAGANFDVLAASLVALAVLRARRDAVGSAIALALGTAAKLYPAASLPFAARGRLAWLAFAGVVAAFYLAVAPLGMSQLGGLGANVTQSANLDSVWGLLSRALAAAGVPAAALGVAVLAAAGLVAAYAIVVLPLARRGADPIAGAALATATLLLFTRVYSPQYSIWLLPFLVLLPISGRPYALLAAADVAVYVTILPLTRVERPGDDPVAVALLGALAGAVVLRHVAIIAIWLRSLRLARSSAAGAGRPRTPRSTPPAS